MKEVNCKGCNKEEQVPDNMPETFFCEECIKEYQEAENKELSYGEPDNEDGNYSLMDIEDYFEKKNEQERF